MQLDPLKEPLLVCKKTLVLISRLVLPTITSADTERTLQLHRHTHRELETHASTAEHILINKKGYAVRNGATNNQTLWGLLAGDI